MFKKNLDIFKNSLNTDSLVGLVRVSMLVPSYLMGCIKSTKQELLNLLNVSSRLVLVQSTPSSNNFSGNFKGIFSKNVFEGLRPVSKRFLSASTILAAPLKVVVGSVKDVIKVNCPNLLQLCNSTMKKTSVLGKVPQTLVLLVIISLLSVIFIRNAPNLRLFSEALMSVICSLSPSATYLI